jgi:hypothetical protein
MLPYTETTDSRSDEVSMRMLVGLHQAQASVEHAVTQWCQMVAQRRMLQSMFHPLFAFTSTGTNSQFMLSQWRVEVRKLSWMYR